MQEAWPQQRDADEACRTLMLLAHQVGVRCAQCRCLILGSENIGGFSYLAPEGTQNWQARCYCHPCATALRKTL